MTSKVSSKPIIQANVISVFGSAYLQIAPEITEDLTDAQRAQFQTWLDKCADTLSRGMENIAVKIR